MMKVNNNKITLDNNKEIIFDLNINTILEFSNCFVVLLLNSRRYINNNVEAWSYEGDKLWNISEIIKNKYPDAYIFIEQGKEDQLITQSFSGVQYIIDVKSKAVVGKNYTK